MDPFAFEDRPLWISVAAFVVSAIVVYAAGSRLAGYADRFATRAGLSGAVVGLLLLGGITSLPEIATSLTAAVGGAAPLAVNNLIGGVALQILFLALADVAIGKDALTSTVPRPDVVAQGAMNVGLLAIVAATVAAGEAELFGAGVGVGAALLLPAYVACVFVARALGREARWLPAGDAAPADEDEREENEAAPIAKLSGLLALTGAVILVAGFTLTRSGEAIAARTGMGESFFGAVFLAGATSLPELSSALAAARLGRPQMAIGDVLGGNLFNLTLILVVDLAYSGQPVLGEVGAFSIVAAALGMLLNAILIIGLIERRDRTVLRMGWDSAAMLLVYGGGLFVLYGLRP